MELIHSPFTPFQVQALNEYQISASQASVLAGHPFTCVNRSDGKHGDEGGDHGVLIATESGWVCPHCNHTQDWAQESMIVQELQASEDIDSSHLLLFDAICRENIMKALPRYLLLFVNGRKGAESMVVSLQRRLDQLEQEESIRQKDSERADKLARVAMSIEQAKHWLSNPRIRPSPETAKSIVEDLLYEIQQLQHQLAQSHQPSEGD